MTRISLTRSVVFTFLGAAAICTAWAAPASAPPPILPSISATSGPPGTVVTIASNPASSDPCRAPTVTVTFDTENGTSVLAGPTFAPVASNSTWAGVITIPNVTPGQYDIS